MGPYYGIPTRRSVDAIILWGQSNAEGYNPTGSNTATYLGTQPNTKIFYKKNDASSTNNGTWQQFCQGVNNNWVDTSLPYCGPDISLGYSYYQQTGRELWIIKYAYNGAALVDDGALYTYGLFQWDANPANCNGLPHYSNMINNFVIPAIIKARANGVDLNIKAIHSMQGEASTNYAARAAAYESTYISMVNRVMLDLASYNVLSPTFKPIVSRIHNGFSPARPYQNEIRTALTNVATYYGSPWIDTDAYAREADNVHFTKLAQETHGIAIATALAAM